jgi:DNA-binding MarR family transcriptional regulator
MPQATTSSAMPARFWDAAHNRAMRNVASLRDQVLAGFELTASEWFVLDIAYAARKNAISVGEVARIMDVQTTYIALVLRHLQTKKLVTTVPDSRDRRVHRLQVTPDGQKLLRESATALERAFTDWVQQHSSAELTAYASVIATLTTGSKK